MNKLAIIGGGAAGLMAAITASGKGADVTLFEQNGEPGKKILASGNGRCNIINTVSSAADFSGEDPSFAGYALQQMDFNAFASAFKRIGLLIEAKPDGRCYPLSNEARSVQAALVRAALHRGVTICLDSVVRQIQKTEKGFEVQTPDAKQAFDKVLICTGSPAAPQLGGNESGFHFAQNLGHTVHAPYPSLVGLHLDHPALSKMSGVKMPARVTLMIHKTAAGTVQDDILFTRYGISGFAILDLSTKASQGLTENETISLNIDLLPDFNPQALAAQIEQMANMLREDTLYDLLCGLLPHKLIRPLLEDAGIPETMPCSELNAKSAKRIVFAIKQWRLPVTDTHGFKHAEAAGGGVSTHEIDPKTMQSNIVPGLFFAGEVIDVVGRRGGFNFHFAWASGYLAAMTMSSEN